MLIAFCATTYAFSTVAGFGWLLIAMGLAQCDRQRVRTRAAYLAAFRLLIAYRELSLATWLANHL